MTISLKHAYQEQEPTDGCRILVNHLWPRGISKEKIKIDEWRKDIAPSNQLRKNFHSGDLNWNNFRSQYLAEFGNHHDSLYLISLELILFLHTLYIYLFFI